MILSAALSGITLPAVPIICQPSLDEGGAAEYATRHDDYGADRRDGCDCACP